MQEKKQKIPTAFVKEFVRAQKILSCPQDWDDENSPPYTREVLERAILFIERHTPPDVPDIEPGPKGSIDVHWKTSNYELLVNIPNDPTSPNTYYGDDYGSFTVKGSFKSTEIEYKLFKLWKRGKA